MVLLNWALDKLVLDKFTPVILTPRKSVLERSLLDRSAALDGSVFERLTPVVPSEKMVVLSNCALLRSTPDKFREEIFCPR